MATTFRLLDDASEAAWDAFVRAQPDGSFFHLAGWRRVIERAFGHKTHYVMAETDGSITGVLPLARVKTMLFGDSLISVPFCVYGGPLAATAEAAETLQAHAFALMRQLAVPVMEFRFRQPPPWIDAADWSVRSDLYVTFRKAIGSDDDANLKAIPRKQRAMVRKGIDRGLTSKVSTDTAQLHAIYAESVRNLGTPVFPHKLFAVLADVFRQDCDIVTIFDGDEAIASVMNFYFRDEVLPYYGGGRRIARDRYANDFMYWEVMRRAAARGCRVFDFGRSKQGTGAFAFKKNWGFTPEPLHYHYCLAAGAAVPDINPLNPKYRMFIAAWKRLPLPLANILGPPIVRGLG